MTQLTLRSGRPVSSLCFGAMQFGGTADLAASEAMYQSCRAAGVTFFDTAHSYTAGVSETLLGKFVQQERDDVFIATKAAYDQPSTSPNIHNSVDQSRQRLGTDVIDLLYLHRYDPATPLEETFEALAKLQSDGVIRYIGVSNFAAWQVMKAQSVAARLGTCIDAIQPMYNLVKRQAEVELLPMARDQSIAVVPYSPLGGGLLTGKYATADASGRLISDDRYARRYGADFMHQAAAQLSEIAAREGLQPASLAVAWVARNPDIAAPIISARSAAQLAPSLTPAPLTDALYTELCALVPTPPPATDRLEEA